MLDIDPDADAGGRRAATGLVDAGVCHWLTYRSETDSTNTLATSADAPATPALFLTDRQSGGRGRHGRAWHSDDGTLTFSILIHWDPIDPAQTNLVPIATGVAIARTIEHLFAPIRAKLKWPNDVYLAGGKTAGILCEASLSAPQHLIIGVGVNVSTQPGLAAGDANRPQSISAAANRPTHRYELLPELVTQIIKTIDQIPMSADTIVADFNDRCLLSGSLVAAAINGTLVTGRCGGITDFGELILQTESGTRHCATGEATLVRGQTQR